MITVNDLIVNLIYVTTTDDGEGFDVEEEVKTEVFAKQKSVKYTQKYLAMQAGVVPEIILEIRMEDWELTKHIVNGFPEYAKKVQIDEAIYSIESDYSPNGSKVFLTLGR